MTSRSRESWPGQGRPTSPQGSGRQGAGQQGAAHPQRSNQPQRPTPGMRQERRRLSHVDRLGRPRMVDVTDKPISARRAVAEATVKMDQETLTLVIDGQGAKGDVLSVAELAGIMAAKRTAELIPLCHPLPLTEITVEITPDRRAGTLVVSASCATTAQTGVEMEAMTAVSVAALTVYDMVKSADRFVTITGIRLMEKTGGKSGDWRRPAPKSADGTADELPGSRAPATRPARRTRRPKPL